MEQASPIAPLVPLLFILVSCVIAIPPLLLHVILHPLWYLSQSDPARVAQQKFFYYAWRVMSPVLDPGDRPHKKPLLARAKGTCLEVGPGVGANIKYYSHEKVERLVLVEPNTDMHPNLRKEANKAGFSEADGSLLLLGCGAAAADEGTLARAGVALGTIDSIMVIHVLCSIPEPAAAIEMYRRLLKPGGIICFYEHVRSGSREIADWQAWYTRYIWPYLFDGCCLDRPTGAWILGGPQAADDKPLSNGVELVHGVGGIQDIVRQRWTSCEIESTTEQNATLLTHVLGWATKRESH